VRKSLGILSLAAVALLAACSGGSQGTTSTIPGGVSSLGHAKLSASGIATKYLGMAHYRPTHMRGDRRHRGGAKDLYVSDVGNNAVDVLANNSWTYSGSITSSINGPDGNWADKKGNVYVANYGGPYVTEYNKAGSLIYTYSSGVSDPVAVTTDSKGHVYEADFNGNYVAEFNQQSNTPVATCYPGGYAEGVAVDKHGNVFVAWTNFSIGIITEYAGGLSGCSGTNLSVPLQWVGGMVLDKHGNIVICDQLAEAVDIIAPPYNAVTSTLGSGWSDPFHVTINKKNKQAYVADAATGEVTVLSYPGGATQAVLGSSNGISIGYSAVDGQNYVP
jgi:hypothetical protein